MDANIYRFSGTGSGRVDRDRGPSVGSFSVARPILRRSPVTQTRNTGSRPRCERSEL